MRDFIAPIAQLIDEFARLPGIGKKTAQRLAFYILAQEKNSVEQFANTLMQAKENIKFCSVCGNFTDRDPCDFCTDLKRDHKTICVVEEAKDILVIEKSGNYNGIYHVLHGCISPMQGITPDDIALKELLRRLTDVEEIIIATNPSVEGEATAMYISRLIKNIVPKITKLAYGLPMGGDIEYADEITLSKAIENRISF